MRDYRIVPFVLLSALAIPMVTSAAGFAKQSLFLSQSSVVEHQTVFIYAVVTDDTETQFSGTLHVTDELGDIGSTSVTLPAGKASTVSVPWTPVAGQHTVTAQLIAKDGTVTESEKATFTVDAAPPPPVKDQLPTTLPQKTTAPTMIGTTTVDSSVPIERSLSTIVPSVAPSTIPVFNAIDSFRKASVTALDGGSKWSQGSITKAASAPGGVVNTLWLVFSTFLLYLCASLAYVISNIALFYPALVVLFLFILWRIYRAIRD